MTPSQDSPNPTPSLASLTQDPTFVGQVQRLHEMTVVARWLFVLFLWLTVGSLSLWALRSDIQQLLDYFTWAALRYSFSLYYNPIPTLGLLICIGMTLGVLVWQSRNILFGLPDKERSRLQNQVLRIRHQGPSHPLWKIICSN
ncbi:hypothetical protein [Phormidium sp. CCY1219]|uniref:hypothetical protein n=1 Tax=Phormidium sp. CCY1219 TaxID=2886104 RepID=UPI002D1EC77A|nr:hypothetical protein [Phormidium sp. CCY1219]MEB3830128.1 hypothetical protein [Phormidium sp. CCY1219]